MRFALISDLHGNIVALEAVLADIALRGVDRTICLGDIIDLGPRPCEVVDRLREAGIPCVLGNHDPLDEHPPLPPLKQVEEWTRTQLNSEQLNWLSALPFDRVEALEEFKLLAVHGNPLSNQQGIEPGTTDEILEDYLSDMKEDVIVVGHTHLQLCRRMNEKLIVNVGSVGMPFLGPLNGPPIILKSIDYALVTADRGVISVELVRLPLDFDLFKKSFDGTNFPDPEGWLKAWLS
ncbi:MAG: metallophosphoesterase family protein [Pseudomonadales bacterium]|nr:metallophosphoesterase family protein [Pseudomonadales bacterium]